MSDECIETPGVPHLLGPVAFGRWKGSYLKNLHGVYGRCLEAALFCGFCVEFTWIHRLYIISSSTGYNSA